MCSDLATILSIFIFNLMLSSHLNSNLVISPLLHLSSICLYPVTKMNADSSGRAVGLWSAAARLLKMWVWIPQAAWMFVSCGCCVLSDRVLCDEPITSPEEYYRLWCEVVCDLETSRMRRPQPRVGPKRHRKKVPTIHEVRVHCLLKLSQRQTRFKVKSITNCTICNLEWQTTSL
jgi:hypothetical protein